MGLQEIPPEIWYLIFKALPTRKDLINVCSVSKLFDTIATPLLYRSVIFRQSHPKTRDWLEFPGDSATQSQEQEARAKFGLFYRLLDDRNNVLRAIVRHITIDASTNTKAISRAKERLQPPQDLLAGLVRTLPNLEAVNFKGELPISESLVDAFLAHKNSPKLYLLGEQGRTPLKVKMPFVQEVSVSVDATATTPRQDADPENPRIRAYEPQTLALNDIFTAFPCLETLSVSVNRLRGGCVIDTRLPSTEIIPLSLRGEAAFPPLKSLSLNGYHLKVEEMPFWGENFPWGQLESLTLGVQGNSGVLAAATGNTHNLKKFEILSYTRFNLSRSTPELERFLCSFHSLESLTAKGLVPSLNSVIQHPDLKHLCLHAIEETDQEREILSSQEIEELDRNCPKLTSLELDLNPNSPSSNDWMISIATNFPNLREASVHVGLGISTAIDKAKDGFPLPKVFASVLTEETARSFAKQFFKHRGKSVLEMMTLKTGETLRWFPQWHPGYANAEQECARTFEAMPPREENDEPHIRELESNYIRSINATAERLKARFASYHVPEPERLSWEPRLLQASDFPGYV